MRIGLDLDATLIKLGVAEYASKELGYNYKDEDIADWNYTNVPLDLKKRIFELFEDPYFTCELPQPLDGAQQKIKEWADWGHELTLITARVPQIREGTIKLVNRLFPQIQDINFVGFNESKSQTMLDKQLQVWIDDAPHGVLDSTAVGIDTYLISNKHTRYNHHLRIHSTLKVVKRVADISF